MSIPKSKLFCFFVDFIQILLYSINKITLEVIKMSELNERKIFSKNLNTLLEKTGKSQKEVADAIHVSPQTFNTWCQGIAIPRMGKVQLLADYFHILKSDLIEDKPETQEQQTYYLDEDAREAADFLHKNPEYKVLFDASRNISKEDIEFVAKMLDKFRK